MAELGLQPVMKCRRCGKPVVVVQLRTAAPDPDGETLRLLSRITLEQGSLCEFHAKQRAWYQSRGRGEEWERGNL